MLRPFRIAFRAQLGATHLALLTHSGKVFSFGSGTALALPKAHRKPWELTEVSESVVWYAWCRRPSPFHGPAGSQHRPTWFRSFDLTQVTAHSLQDKQVLSMACGPHSTGFIVADAV